MRLLAVAVLSFCFVMSAAAVLQRSLGAGEGGAGEGVNVGIDWGMSDPHYIARGSCQKARKRKGGGYEVRDCLAPGRYVWSADS